MQRSVPNFLYFSFFFFGLHVRIRFPRRILRPLQIIVGRMRMKILNVPIISYKVSVC